MPQPSNANFDTHKNVATYLKIASIQTGLLLQSLNYYSVKRMVEIIDDEVDVDSDCEDGLAELFVEALSRLSTTVGKTDVTPLLSISALFETGALQRSLKPQCCMAMDLRDNAKIVGCLISCRYIQDETLGTQLFTPAFCQRHRCPRFNREWCFVDVVSSKKKPSGSLLLANSLVIALRQKLAGLVLVAVSTTMRDLCTSIGFTSVQYNDRGPRYLCYLRMNDLTFENIMKKLRFPGDKVVVEDICWRLGLTSKTATRVIGRC